MLPPGAAAVVFALGDEPDATAATTTTATITATTTTVAAKDEWEDLSISPFSFSPLVPVSTATTTTTTTTTATSTTTSAAPETPSQSSSSALQPLPAGAPSFTTPSPFRKVFALAGSAAEKLRLEAAGARYGLGSSRYHVLGGDSEEWSEWRSWFTRRYQRDAPSSVVYWEPVVGASSPKGGMDTRTRRGCLCEHTCISSTHTTNTQFVYSEDLKVEEIVADLLRGS